MHPAIVHELVRAIHADREREARRAALASLVATDRVHAPGGRTARRISAGRVTAIISRVRASSSAVPCGPAGASDAA